MIEIAKVTKRFGAAGGVEDINLAVAPGRPVVIQGPSGSGKTTLLRLIAGLEEPDAGEIRIDSVPASRAGRVLAPHLRGIGMAFQHPALWPHMTVSQNIRFAIRNGAGNGWLGELLEAAELDALADRYPNEISGGEAARAALARALAGRPRHLLLDEPLAHLDEARKRRYVGLILGYAEAFEASVVYVTHDRSEAALAAGSVYRMEDGRLHGPAV